MLSTHKESKKSPQLTFMPTPSQKTAVTGSEHGGYLTEEEEDDTNNFT